MNVSARISEGFARREAISQAIRRVMTWVLPVPAPATTSSGPSPCVTARSWSGFSPPSSASMPLGAARPAGDRRVHDRHELAPGRDLFEWHRPAPPRADDRAGHGDGVRAGTVGSAMGAMCAPSPTAVTPRLSGAGLADGGGLLLGQRRLRATAADGLRVHARARAGVQARQHPAVAFGVEQREREALVAAGLLERVVADEADPLEGAQPGALERPGPSRQSSTSRPRPWTFSRCAPSTASRLSPSSPRVMPRSRRPPGRRAGRAGAP